MIVAANDGTVFQIARDVKKSDAFSLKSQICLAAIGAFGGQRKPGDVSSRLPDKRGGQRAPSSIVTAYSPFVAAPSMHRGRQHALLARQALRELRQSDGRSRA